MPIQLPIGSEDTFKGIVDLVEMDAEIYYDDLGKDVRREPIPDDMKELGREVSCKAYRACRDQDDELMEKYFNGEEFTVEEIKRTIRKSTIENKMVPITCGTSYRNPRAYSLFSMQ